MTDEEILKAFQLCNTDTDCDTNGCPYNDMVEDCISMLNNDIISRFNELKAENAALRERLEKAVNKRVVANMLAKYFDCPCNFSPIDEEMFDFCNECCNDNVICWEKVIEKSNAEARLAKLNGGKER